MKRYLVALGAASLVGTVVLGSAAALGVDGGVAQAGVDRDLTCQDSPVTVTQWHEFDNSVDPVSVGALVEGIENACEGQYLIVTAFDGAGNYLGQFTKQIPLGSTFIREHWEAGDIPLEDIYQLNVGIVS